MTKDPERYFVEGCGRCEKFATPACYVHRWANVLAGLRTLALEAGLHEEAKWGSPCYTLNSKNVLLLGAFKNYCVISFFKAGLLQNKDNLLVPAGENSQTASCIKINSDEQFFALEPQIAAYIQEAKAIEQAGKQLPKTTASMIELPAELISVFGEDTLLHQAFLRLTPGRQRGYAHFFSSAKQPATRLARIEKMRDKILAGKGFQE